VNPRTSVITPAHNAHATVRGAVESALAQTVPDLEVIVVDDGSDTPIAAALEGIDDPRLRLLTHSGNEGASAARNTALAIAEAPLVSTLDADDTWEPRYLETVLPLFDDPAVGLAYTNAFITGHPDGNDTYIHDPSVHPMDTFPKIAEQNPIPAVTATMRTDAVRAIGGWPGWIPLSEDYWVYLQLAAAGWRFAYVHERLATYGWPAPGHSQSYAAERRRERDLLKMYAAFVLRHPRTPGPRRQVRTRLRQELRRPRGR
jgi:glycosyltransferase involved in cell wall biosynthesis